MQGEHVGVVESIEAEHAIVLFGSLDRNNPRLRVSKKPQISYQDHQKTLEKRAQKSGLKKPQKVIRETPVLI